MNDDIAVGDKLRLNTKSIETINKKLGGLSQVVEVVSVVTGEDGIKVMTVKLAGA